MDVSLPAEARQPVMSSSLHLEFADGKMFPVFSSQFFSNKKLVRKNNSG